MAGLVGSLFMLAPYSEAASRPADNGILGGAKAATAASAAAATASASALPQGFQENVVFNGLTQPTVMRFSSDGRIFIAEKSGIIKVYDSLDDPTPTVFADLSGEVDNYWDRGLLGLALDPNFPTTPYVYVLYTYDAPIGGNAPTWNDACPSPPGPTTNGCVVSGRLSRLTLGANDTMVPNSERVFINDWCQQFPSHSIGSLAFGSDGDLYVSGGDGASFNYADYGQTGNPCGDPPSAAGTNLTAPTAEGGALRSQDLRTSSDSTGLNGAILRLDPSTGAAASGNPLTGPDANAMRIVAEGFRNPFRFTIKPGTNEVWVGDVGWNDWEEIDRITNPTSFTNFGWPCYEGAGRQDGYDSANLNICENLYAAGSGAVVSPYYTYNHASQVVSGETCPTSNGSSISGLAFYTGGTYPTAYNGALFFADYTRKCIWVMLPGANGLPDPNNRANFVMPAAGPVDLEIGPGGDLFYVDYDTGTIRRLQYGSTPPPPPGSCPSDQFSAQYFSNATLVGNPALSVCETAINHDWGTGGPGSPVPVDNFSARWTGTFTFAAGTTTFTATADDGIRVWVDGALIIDHWVDEAPTTYTVPRMLTAGTHDIKVEYYEHAGGAVAKVSWTTTSGSSCSSGQFSAQYFSNQNLAGNPALTACENTINHDWGTGGPGSPIPVDGFSARWMGTFTFTAGNATFTATADDGIRVWVDGTLIIDHWIDEAPTTYTVTRAMTAGAHDVQVEYYENAGGAVAKVSWTGGSGNSPPAAVIDTPASSLTWKVGDSISFTGHATDPEQGTLLASALSWTLAIEHCPSTCHEHIVQTWSGVASGSFSAPDHGYPSYLQLRMTATDAGGLTSTAVVNLNPITVDLSFAGAPSGLQLTVNSATSTSPFTVTVIKGSANSISAPSPQTLSGTSYTFSSWSDGGAATHNIVANAAATYTATFAAGGPSSCSSGQFTAQYFANTTSLRGNPALTVCENAINHDWGTGGPGGPIPTDDFSARWTGTFAFPTGTTTFTATADDGIRVWVDGTLIIDHWVDESATTYTVTRTLSAGSHDIKVEYYEGLGNAVAKVSWQTQ